MWKQDKQNRKKQVHDSWCRSRNDDSSMVSASVVDHACPWITWHLNRRATCTSTSSCSLPHGTTKFAPRYVELCVKLKQYKPLLCKPSPPPAVHYTSLQSNNYVYTLPTKNKNICQWFTFLPSRITSENRPQITLCQIFSVQY